MTALSAARLIVEKEDVFSTLPVKGSTTLQQGGLVCMEGGVAVPGKTDTDLTAIGLSVTTVVNAGADGSVQATVKRGTFRFDNLGADAVSAADIGKDCYIVDDQTVAKTSGASTRSVAGTVIDVDSAGVWVRIV
jgi:hypothetical protein